MKKIYTILFVCVAFLASNAASYTISIAGFAYSPNTLTVSIGDVVTIQANGSHPLTQVDEPTWTAGGTTTVSGGWGVTTADHTFTITNTNTIYYVCGNHVGMGMKGQIGVGPTGLNEQVKALSQLALFPLPASEKLNVNFELKQDGLVNISLLNINGQVAAVLFNEPQLAGTKQMPLVLPSTLAPGAYFIKTTVNSVNSAEKLILIK